MGIVVVGQYQIDGFGGPWDTLWVVPCLWLTDGKDPPPPPPPRQGRSSATVSTRTSGSFAAGWPKGSTVSGCRLSS